MLAHIAPRIFIIIHGTWASQTTWYKEGGDFYTSLADNCHDDDTVISFTWSGKLDHKSRLFAGKELAKHLQKLPLDSSIIIVAHSHGANVGIIACQELSRKKNNAHKIDKFYALAPPVNSIDYMPAMDVIQHFYNFFSLQDYVQPVLGIFGRTYPDHPRIANIRVILENRPGNHSQMHDEMIGQWIPHIHEKLATKELGNFHKFAFGKPSVIYFFDERHPHYQEDTERDKLLELDRKTHQKMLLALKEQRS